CSSFLAAPHVVVLSWHSSYGHYRQSSRPPRSGRRLHGADVSFCWNHLDRHWRRPDCRMAQRRTSRAFDASSASLPRERSRQLLAAPEGFRHRLHGAHWSGGGQQDRKSTRLNSSHVSISYAVF